MSAAVSLPPASARRSPASAEKLLVIDAASNALRDTTVGDFPKLVAPGDLVVVNDAATFPASLHGRTRAGDVVEARLTEPPRGSHAHAILFGAGDFRIRTEDRHAPPRLRVGDEIVFDGLVATVAHVDALSARLVDLHFDREGILLWKGLFSAGKPVQYAYIRDELALWDVQTPFAGRPFAAEMPSAGRPLSWAILAALRARGANVARLTHAAGLSSTGDPALDARLPLVERFVLPSETVVAISEAKQTGARVIAIGTTVVRALEGSFAAQGRLVSGEGETDWLVGPAHPPRVVDAIFSGMHEPQTSHFSLLEAFAPTELLTRAMSHAAASGYRGHELGDACFVGRGLLAD